MASVFLPGRGAVLTRGLLVAAVGLTLYGLIRFTFNLLGLRVFSAAFVGDVSLILSAETLIAVLWSAVPAVIASKFIGEAIGVEDVGVARTLAGAVVALSFFVCCLSLAAPLILFSGTEYWYLHAYGGLFGAYVVTRSMLFAFGERRLYFRAEALGSLLFFLVFGLGCQQQSRPLAALSLLLHPLTMIGYSMLGLRNHLKFAGGLHVLRSRAAALRTFAWATFLNAATGLGGFHIALVLTGFLVRDSVVVGTLSAMMASLAPLVLLPQAATLVLVPEIARRFGRNDVAGQVSLTRVTALGFQAFTLLVGYPILLFSATALNLIGVEPTFANHATWLLLSCTTLVSIVSSPCGHLLNATAFVDQHAKLATTFLVLGTAIGAITIPFWGLVGAGWMRAANDGLLAWARMLLAQRRVPWVGPSPSFLLMGQSALVAAAMASLADLTTPVRVILVIGGWILGACILRAAWTGSDSASPGLQHSAAEGGTC